MSLAAERIHCPECLSVQKDRPARQTAVLPNPVANRRGIRGGDSARRFLSLSGILVAILVDDFCRMKAEDCPPGDADSASRDRV